MKRSITIAGHRTSVFVEDEFWQALGEIATKRGMSGAALIAEIDEKRGASTSRPRYGAMCSAGTASSPTSPSAEGYCGWVIVSG